MSHEERYPEQAPIQGVPVLPLETVNKRRKRLLNATRVAPFLVVGAWVFSLAAITQSREDTNGDGEEDGGSSFPFRTLIIPVLISLITSLQGSKAFRLRDERALKLFFVGNGLLLAMLTVYIVAFILDLNSGGMSDRGLMFWMLSLGFYGCAGVLQTCCIIFGKRLFNVATCGNVDNVPVAPPVSTLPTTVQPSHRDPERPYITST